MNGSHCPEKQQLADFTSGKLPEDEASSVSQHVAVCASCEATVQSLETKSDTLASGLREAPPKEPYVDEPGYRQAVSELNKLPAGGKPKTPQPAEGRTPAADVTTPPSVAPHTAVSTPGNTPQKPAAKPAEKPVPKLGPYKLLAKLGEGGMGAVYKALHEHLGKTVAIKVLPKKAMQDQAAVARFRREMKAVGALHHPNIVGAHDAGEAQGIHYLVMEYVEGSDLSGLVKKQGPLSVEKAVSYVRQAACGLAFAHAKGVVHRDIKPANLLVDTEGTLKILDMGLARLDDGDPAAREGLTQTGQVMGTVDYMAPEQAFDTHTADGKADVYSLGCTLYRILTGHNMFTADTLVQKILAHRESSIPALGKARPDVPPQLDSLYQRMVAKKPEQRPTMAEVASELEALDKGARGQGSGASSGPALEVVIDTGKAESGKRKADAKNASPERQRREPAAKPQAKKSGGKSKPPLKWIAAGVGGFAMLCLGVIIYINGTRVEVPDNSTVSITQDGTQRPEVRVTLPTTEAPKVAAVSPSTGDYALQFEDETSVELASLTRALDLVGPMTIEAWVTPHPKDPGQALVFGTLEPMFGLYINNSGNWDFRIHFDKPAKFGSNEKWGYGFTSGQWARPNDRFHVAAVRTVDQFLLFVNGAKVASNATAPAALRALKQSITIGGVTDKGYFHGIIDELRVSKTGRYETNFTPQTRFEPDADTTALYHFDEGAGDVLHDASGNKHDGKIVGAKWVRVDGRAIIPPSSTAIPNFALRLDPKQMVTLSIEKAALSSHDAQTLEFWARPDRTDLSEYVHLAIMGRYGADNRMTGRYWLGNDKKGGWTAAVAISNGSNATPPASLSVERMSHLAMTFEGGRRIRFFADGKYVGKYEATLGLPPELLTHLWLGNHAHNFAGEIDEVRLSRAVRYTGDFVPERRFEPDANTVALYHCDEGAGDVLHDASGNGHDGKIVGAKWVRADGSPIATTAGATANLPSTAVDPERRVAGWVLRRNGKVGICYSGGEREVSALDDLPDEPFVVLDIQPPLVQTPITREEWQSLGELRAVGSMNFSGCDPTDEALAAIARCRTLRTLTIAFDGTYGDAGLAEIAKLPRLGSLDIGNCAMTAAGLEHLGKLTRLRSLKLASTPKLEITSLAPLAGLKSLELLELNSTTAGDAAVADLANFPRLKHLNLARTRVTPAAIDSLLRCANLRVVTLMGVRLTSESLRKLAAHPTLSVVNINGAGLKPDEYKQLAAALPRVTLLHPDLQSVYAEELATADWASTIGAISIGHYPALREATAIYGFNTDVQVRKPVAAEELRRLSALKNVTTLGFTSKGTPAQVRIALQALREHPNLASFMPASVGGLAAADLTELPRHTDLRTVSFGYSNATTDETLAVLASLPDLIAFNVDSSQISDKVFEHLAKMPALRTLTLGSARINGSGLALLRNAPRLAYLRLGKTGIVDAALPPLATMPELEQLYLDSTPITDAGLVHLEGCRELRVLNVQKTKVTAAGVAKLHAALPDCLILWDGPTQAASAPKNATLADRAFQAWLKATQALPAEQEIEAVSKKLMELNPGFDGKLTDSAYGGKKSPKIDNGVVVDVGLVTDHVENIAPLRAFSDLKRLFCSGSIPRQGRLVDLSPLAGLPLTNFGCAETQVADLSPLAGMPLKALVCNNTQVKDLTPLVGMPLTDVRIFHTAVSDLTPLKGMKIGLLYLHNTPVSDLSPLAGMPLAVFNCSDTQVADLTPLKGMPLSTLWFHDTPVSDMTPLAEMSLKSIRFTPVNIARGIEVLREMPSVADLGVKHATTGGDVYKPAEFWKKYDAGEFAKPATPKKLAYLDPKFQQWVEATQKLPAEQQLEAVSKKLMELNPGFDGKLTGFRFEFTPQPYVVKGVVTEVGFLTDKVTDLSPVRAFPGLTGLAIGGEKALSGLLTDLSPLAGLPLKSLNVGSNRNLSDLAPLEGMQLTSFASNYTAVTDFAVLQGMPLAYLHTGNAVVADLSFVQGMPLEIAYIKGTFSDLSPLRGMKLRHLSMGQGSQVTDLSPLKGMPLAILNADNSPLADLSPLVECKQLKTLTVKMTKVTAAGVAALQKALPDCKITWDDPTTTPTKPLAYLDPAFQQWVAETQKLSAEKQLEVVSKKLMELNPGFDGVLTGYQRKDPPKIQGGVVTELGFVSDNAIDLSPVRALPGLKALNCGGTSPSNGHLSDLSPLSAMSLTTLNFGSSQVSDLSPLRGMKLTHLEFHYSQVSDLSPLVGMPLDYLNCGGSPVSDLSPLKETALTKLICSNSKNLSDLSPLRGMRLTSLGCSLTQVADLSPLAECKDLKSLSVSKTKVTAEQVAALQKALPDCKITWDDPTKTPTKPLAYLDPTFQQWVEATQKLPAEKQLEAVSKKLMELNPGFDGKLAGVELHPEPKIETGVVTELGFYCEAVSDLSPVRALSGLKKLGCSGRGAQRAKYSDLSPVEGLQLDYLAITGTDVSDLAPLSGMPLATLHCAGSRVEDLSPLRGAPLTRLLCKSTRVTDLSPLAGMPLVTFECNGLVADISPLAGMPLVTLMIEQTQVTDLSALHSCKELKSLKLSSKITDEHVAAIQTALPQCKIERVLPKSAPGATK